MASGGSERVATPAADAPDSIGTPPAAPDEQPPAEDGDPPASETGSAAHRFEEFDATRPDGTVVRVRRNIDTGEQSVTPA